MNNYQKWVLMGVCVTSFSIAYADQPSSKDKSSKMEMTYSDEGMPLEITPVVPPAAIDKTRFFVTADFIYWRAEQDHLSIAANGVSTISIDKDTPSATLNSVNQGRQQNLDFGYEPGFKFGIGLDLPLDGWDTCMNYTWYQSTDVSGAISQDIYSYNKLYGPTFWLAGNSVLTDIHVEGLWGLYFNNVDWELGRKFFISPKLILRPHIGIKGAWMHQRFNIYEDIEITRDDLGANPLLVANGNTYQKQRFWGVGLRAGLNTEWHLNKWFSFYGDFALAELYGQVSSKAHLDVANINLMDGTPFHSQETPYNQKSSLHRLAPVLEIALGFRAETTFGRHECCNFFFQAGWEQQIWWDQNQFLVTNPIGTTSSNLNFQGLDLKVGFTF